MNAALISIGDELTLGQILDTNAAYLADHLAQASVVCLEHLTLGDERARLAAALRRLAHEPGLEIIIITGGLGPTADDITREALADALGEALVEDPAGLDHLRRWFHERGVSMPARNRQQALRPASAQLIDNARGTAPGIRARLGDTDVFALPGVPHEMKHMFHESVLPLLRREGGEVLRTLAVRCFGLGESSLAERLGDLMERERNPTVGTTASEGIISVRIRAVGDPHEVGALVEKTARRVEELAGVYAFGREDDTLASVVLEELKRAGATIAVAESCTGGLLGAMITAVPGCSAAFVGGYLTYSNELKERELNVPAAHFREGGPGAVSEEVARAMAEGARQRTSATHALAITGIAGPEGGTAAKPVGTVCIALASEGGDTQVRRFQFTGSRDIVRDRSAKAALAILLWRLRGQEDFRMLWQKTNGESVK